MILCDTDLIKLMEQGLIEQPDYSLVNPASIDIRVGREVYVERGHGDWHKLELDEKGYHMAPNEFILVGTWESFNVPNGYAMDLRLKSSIARQGYDHSLAFWVDPGWRGVLTMEIRNTMRYNGLTLIPGKRFAQVIVHKLSGLSAIPYRGRYKGADSVEIAKPEQPVAQGGDGDAGVFEGRWFADR